jgi:hypothetical protein
MISSDSPCKQNRPRTEGLTSVFFIRPRGTAGLVKRAMAFLCLTALLSALHPAVVPAADPKSRPVVIVSDDFEKWSWEPITFSMRNSGRKRLKAGKQLPFEYRGPLYRRAKGFSLQTGRMVEGAEAFKGQSMLLANCQVGLHGRYSKIVEAGATYRYEVSLKGQGTFHFRAWVGANDPTTGEFRWLGFPDLVKIQATDSWQTHKGEFQLPEFDTTTFKLPAKTSAAIVVREGDEIVVDDFTVWLLEKE